MRSSTKFSPKFFTAMLCVAFVSFLSCSDSDSDSSSSSGPRTQHYTVTDITSDYIRISIPDEWGECKSDGFKTESWTRTINYSIDNGVMSANFGYGDKTIDFNGNSNDVKGTWTRNKNKSESCGDIYGYGSYYCIEGFDIVKLDISQTQIAVTQDICLTDEMEDGRVRDGWTYRISDCNSYTISKGSHTIKVYEDYKNNIESWTFTYNGKTCSGKSSSLNERRAACNSAIATCASSSDSYCIEDAFYDIIENYADFDSCMQRNMPEEFVKSFYGDGDYGDGDSY